MLAILDRLKGCGEFEIVIFGDKVIVEDPITEWPRCDCLLSWHSDGFPLKKVCMHKHLIRQLHSDIICAGDTGLSPLLTKMTSICTLLSGSNCKCPRCVCAVPLSCRACSDASAVTGSGSANIFRVMQAQRYANLRKPYLINDMQLQDLLLDRRAVYATLEVLLSPTAWSCYSSITPFWCRSC